MPMGMHRWSNTLPTAVLNAKKIATVVERKEILHIPHGMLRCDKNAVYLLNLMDYRFVDSRVADQIKKTFT